jgi:acyl carrier protein
MSDIDVRKVVQEELGNVAPEIDFAAVDPAADLREAIDIDSMDFLNFIAAIHHRIGVDIPEIDYPKLVTLDGAVAYIEAKLATKSTSASNAT